MSHCGSKMKRPTPHPIDREGPTTARSTGRPRERGRTRPKWTRTRTELIGLEGVEIHVVPEKSIVNKNFQSILESGDQILKGTIFFQSSD